MSGCLPLVIDSVSSVMLSGFVVFLCKIEAAPVVSKHAGKSCCDFWGFGRNCPWQKVNSTGRYQRKWKNPICVFIGKRLSSNCLEPYIKRVQERGDA